MKLKHTILFLVVLLISSCGKTEVKPEDKFRTVLVYLAANNSLQLEAEKNMSQMEEHIGDIDGNLIVYAKLPNELPALYEITKKNGTVGGRKKIKEYLQHNSSDPLVLEKITKEVQTLYPAKTHGLILWSHATGWIPESHGNIKLKSFGDDNGYVMDITDLSRAIPNNYDFIMFDACSMASVEVLYEIKDKAKILIASPAEVISSGMPYDKMTNLLFKPGIESYLNIAQTFYNHYNNLSGGFRSATISVIDASQLSNLAIQTKAILQVQTPNYSDYNRDHIQRMDFDRSGNPLIAFDFMDFIDQNYNNKTALIEALNKSVVYKANTPLFNNIEITTNSGLTCYIPHQDNNRYTHDFYKTLKWYNDSGFEQLFKNL